MAKKPIPAYINNKEFEANLHLLSTPALNATQDVNRTVDVLTYMGMRGHWLSWQQDDELFNARKTLIDAVERVDWSLYTENFVHIASNFYSYLEECIRRSEQSEREAIFVKEFRETKFAKLCALAYALVVDVHPDRRKNLRPRIEAWSGVGIDEHAPTMLGALLSAWSHHDAAAVLGNYGSVLSTLDPQSSRSALVLNNLWRQMEGKETEPIESIDFLFDSSQ